MLIKLRIHLHAPISSINKKHLPPVKLNEFLFENF